MIASVLDLEAIKARAEKARVIGTNVFFGTTAEVVYEDLPRLIAEVERLRKDEARLDWIEANRALVNAITSDKFREGKPPRLLRFYVEDGGWKRTGRMDDVYAMLHGEGRSLREAIDAAVKETSEAVAGTPGVGQ